MRCCTYVGPSEVQGIKRGKQRFLSEQDIKFILELAHMAMIKQMLADA
jgi:hypothetical protein